MKAKGLSLLILVFGLTINKATASFFIIHSSDSVKIVPDTLVAYYPFSGSASDSSGFGNDGVVYGAQLTKDRFGNPNSAYKFDGGWDYISIPHKENFSSPQKTVNFWFKKSGSTIDVNSRGTYGEGLAFKSFDTGIDREFGIEIFGAEAPYDLSFSVGSIAGQKNIAARKDSSILPGIWYQVTAVIDSTSISLYLDGTKVDSTEYSGGLFRNSAPVVLGKVSVNSIRERYLQGYIDDFRMYNYALSDVAIKNLYAEKGWPNTKYVIPDTLVAYYPFSGSAEDVSGFGNHGEAFGASLTRDRFGNENSAFKFDGFDDFIEIPHNSIYNTDVKTVAFWFKKTSFEIEESYGINVEGLVWKAFDTGFTRDYSFSIGNATSPFDIYNNVGNGADELLGNRIEDRIEPHKWYHVVGIVDSVKSILFLNGEVIQTIEKGWANVHSNAPISIGKSSLASETPRYFTGIIDDLEIYNYELSDSTVMNLYTEGGWPSTKDSVIVPNDTLAAFYPFNGDASDSSGYGNHGQVFGASLTSDRFGKNGFAYHFDGNDDFIEISNPQMLHSKKNLSVSFWAKGTSSDSSITGIITKTNMQPFGVGIDDGGRILFSISDDNIPLNMVIKDINTNGDEWYQYVAVFKAGEYMRLFQNGTEVGTLYGSIPLSMDVTPDNVLIGATRIATESDIDTLFFKGDIDEIRFYNHDLSPEEVAFLYQMESELPLGPLRNEGLEDIPQKYKLYQNYPNPFNPTTVIPFDIPKSDFVEIKIYDINGRLVLELLSEFKVAGTHEISFNAGSLASGIYFYQLKTDRFISTKKLTLIK